MIIHIAVFPEAKDDKDCVPEAMTYQEFCPDWEYAARALRSMESITKKDAKALEDKKDL